MVAGGDTELTIKLTFLRDEEVQRQLEKDPLRWTGGCKVMLLLAFVCCLDDNINQLNDIR